VPELADIVQLRPVAGRPACRHPSRRRCPTGCASNARPGRHRLGAPHSANLQPDDAASTTQLLEQQARFIARWKDYLAAS